MTFHDLGTLGSAEVVPKKSLRVMIDMSWEDFSGRFAADLRVLSPLSNTILMSALISQLEVKIDEEGEELDMFFAKIKTAGAGPNPKKPSTPAVSIPGHPEGGEDWDKFAEEIFRPRDALGTGQELRAARVQQKRIARIQNEAAWIEATNDLVQEYLQLAKQPHPHGNYSDSEDLLTDIRHGKVFVFPANSLDWACACLFFVVAGIFLWVFLSLYTILMAIFFIAIGLEPLFSAARTSILVMGPRGIAWRIGGFLWEDVHMMRSVGIPVELRNRFGRVVKTVKKWTLDFLLWDGSTRHIRLNNIGSEWPGMNPNEFIALVAEGMYRVYGRKNPP